MIEDLEAAMDAKSPGCSLKLPGRASEPLDAKPLKLVSQGLSTSAPPLANITSCYGGITF